MFDLGKNPIVADAEEISLLPLHPVKHQADPRGVDRTGNDIHQATDVTGNAESHGDAENLLGHFDGARQKHGTAGHDHPRGQQVFISRFFNLSLHQLKDFIQPGLDDLAKNLP